MTICGWVRARAHCRRDQTVEFFQTVFHPVEFSLVESVTSVRHFFQLGLLLCETIFEKVVFIDRKTALHFSGFHLGFQLSDICADLSQSHVETVAESAAEPVVSVSKLIAPATISSGYESVDAAVDAFELVG